MTSEPPQQRTFPAEAVRIGDVDQIQRRRSVMSAAAYEAGQFRTMCWANRVPSLGMMKHEFSSRTGRSREPWPNGGCAGPGTMRDEMRPSHGRREPERWGTRGATLEPAEPRRPWKSVPGAASVPHVPHSNLSPFASLKIPTRLF